MELDPQTQNVPEPACEHGVGIKNPLPRPERLVSLAVQRPQNNLVTLHIASTLSASPRWTLVKDVKMMRELTFDWSSVKIRSRLVAHRLYYLCRALPLWASAEMPNLMLDVPLWGL